MNYRYEFDRLLDSVEQFIKCPQSKAALQVLKNASQYYKERRKTVRPQRAVQQPQGVICESHIAGGFCSVHADKDWVCGGEPCVFRKRTPVR